METFQITDPKIIQFFKNNEFIDPKKFIEKHIISVIEKPNSNEKKENLSDTDIDFQQLHTEYSIFIRQRKNIMNFMKENNKLVEKLQLEYLDSILSNKLDIKKEIHSCDLCDRGFRNLKALTTHHRSCLKKIDEDEENVDEEDS
jgi:hypothetical protein